MSESRKDRLASDYREMLKIQNRPYLSWTAAKGELPYAEEYLLSVNLRTYVFSMRSGVCTVGAISRCTVKVTLWDSYPYIAPNIRMLDIPPVFHPAWYSKGAYSPSAPWDPETSLKSYIISMLKTLQYDPSVIDTAAPANYKALDWYMKNRENITFFPSDTTILSENTPVELNALERSIDTFSDIVDTWTVK